VHRMKSIKYPDNFRKEVKEEFEGRKDVINLLENGRYVLGKILLSESKVRMDPFDVVDSFKKGKQQEVFEAASAATRRWRLYRKWVSLMLEACESHEEDMSATH
jgi:hypothetical protein